MTLSPEYVASKREHLSPDERAVLAYLVAKEEYRERRRKREPSEPRIYGVYSMRTILERLRRTSLIDSRNRPTPLGLALERELR